ncbi:DNA polymerase III subunit gamma/tau [Mycoplasma sp. 1018B]|uniref:DNA polymerase III subunit gamma/tau n=1 Tax=Mycoplasma sp. 1018B TaxID=2967302 RepID=UPI00211D0A56|nr:DNA polymerase III subunit gamma/tau [Mycoplasma sp. 1018B]UUM19079.1 DNA polymerase III subunit gamma/tau [Mycoplasma sp. 1018B]
MSYKALYRKYRPQKFEQVVGQEHIIKVLENIIISNNINHAYLFSGSRGVGKTSLAKIFANAINCIHTNIPYDICENCLEKSANNLDIIEMDAASNNGVEEIRMLQEKIEHLPTVGRYKIYIIDEVHMLTKSAFNSLLKTLEEPPSHVIFILATTDAQKIPSTVLSRLQIHNFKKITNKQIENRLKEIFEIEKIQYDNDTPAYIARLAQGALRDALSIAEQAIAYCDNNLTLKSVTELFGIVENSKIINFFNAIYKHDYSYVINTFDEFKNNNADAKILVENWITVLKDYLVCNKTNNLDFSEILLENDFELIEFNTIFAYETLEYLYQLLKSLYNQNKPYDLIYFNLFKIMNRHNSFLETNDSLIKKEKMQENRNSQNDQTNKVQEELKINNNSVEKEIKDILEQSQEYILKYNNAKDDIKNIENEILTFNDDLDDENLENPLISTEEFDINQNSDVTLPLLKTYTNDKIFKSQIDDELLEKLFALHFYDKKVLNPNNKNDQIKTILENSKNLITNLECNDFIKAISTTELKVLASASNFILIHGNSKVENKILNYLQDNYQNEIIQREFFQKLFKKQLHLFITSSADKDRIKTIFNKVSMFSNKELEKYKPLENLQPQKNNFVLKLYNLISKGIKGEK